MKIIKKSKFFICVMALLSAFATTPLVFADDSDSDGDSTVENSDDIGVVDDEEGTSFPSIEYDPDDPLWKWLSDSGSDYQNALDKYDAAVAAGIDDETLAELRDAVEECYAAIEEFCNQYGIDVVHSDTTGYLCIMDEDGQPAIVCGDPVSLSNGSYIMSDSDSCLKMGMCGFSVKRSYRSGKTDDREEKYGSFGRLWNSNLDTRIIRGFSQKEIDNIDIIVNAIESIEDYRTEINDMESSCDSEEFLEVKEKIESLMAEHEAILDRCRLSEKNKELSSLTLYGIVASMVENIGTEYLVYVSDDGTPILFKSGENSKYVPVRSDLMGKMSMEESEDGFTITIFDGEVRKFDFFGVIKSVSRKNGSKVDFETQDGRVIGVTLRNITGGTRRLSISRNLSGLVTSVTDGVSIFNYTYSDNTLRSVTDPDGDTRSFDYDGNFLTNLGKADGSAIKIVYKDGKVTQTIDEEGHPESFDYSTCYGTTVYKDHDGVKSLYRYDDKGHTVFQSFADGSEMSFTYDELGELSGSYGSSGAVSYERDECGNILKALYSDGTCDIFEYDRANLVSKTDRDGVRTTFEYDEYGNISGMYSGGKQTAVLEYEDGNLIKFTDVFGNFRKYKYNEFGEMVEKSVYANGKENPSSVEKWEYDSVGRVMTYKNTDGVVFKYQYAPHVTIISGSDRTERRLEYSNRKCLKSESITDNATGEFRVFDYEYDKARRRTGFYVSGKSLDGTVIGKTLLESYEYTPEGRLSKIVKWNSMSECDVDGWTCSYSFDGENISGVSYGRICSDSQHLNEFHKSVDDINRETRLLETEYSSAGRLLKARCLDGGFYEFDYDKDSGRFLGTREVGGVRNVFNSIEYFDNGKRKSVTDRLGNKIEYSYDEFGNVSQIKDSKTSIKFLYDAAGRILSKSIVSDNGKTIASQKFVYSDLHRKVSVYFGTVRTNTLIYDSFGRLMSDTDANGNTKRYGYDILGRCIFVLDAYGNKTSYEYDSRNMISKILFVDGSFIKYHYDSLGNCIRIEDSVGDVSRSSYDCFGRLVEHDERPFSTPEKYEYDNFGRLCSVKKGDILLESYKYADNEKIVSRYDSKGRVIESETDGFGRVLSQKNRLGLKSSYTYDAEASVSSIVGFDGKETLFEKSADGQSVSTLRHDGRSFVKYDDIGRMIVAKNDNNELQYSYNAFGKLDSIYDKEIGVRIFYTYDNVGNLLRIQSKGGVERDISYTYGKNGEILRIIDSMSSANVAEIEFSYDKMGREIARHYKSGESILSTYDKAGRMILRVGYDARLNLVFVDGYVYDDNGHLSLSLDSNFNVTRYEYNSQGRLSSVSYPYTDSMRFHFDNMLEEAGGSRHDISVSRLAIYPFELESLQSLCRKIGQGTCSLSANQSVLVESFEYDSEGNIIKRRTPLGVISYTYDDDNRLVGFGKVVLEYDKNGNLVQKKTANATYRFEYNSENRMIRMFSSDAYGNMHDISYKYDYFGRRIVQNGSRTVYDGMGLRVLYSTEEDDISFDNHTQGYKSVGRFSSKTDYSSGRYFFISDDNDDIYESETPQLLYRGSVAPVYFDNVSPIAFSSVGGDSVNSRTVLMSDLQGSVKTSVGDDGFCSNLFYDVFGSAVGTPSYYGFVGKRYDSVSKTYDFGYRDYSSSIARFTTIDPIKDGRNWYAYCAGNPVDYVDVDGYEISKNNSGSNYENSRGYTEYDMHDSRWASAHLGMNVNNSTLGTVTYKENGSDNTITYEGKGCTVTAVAEALSNLFGVDITPTMLNSNPNFFDSDGNFKSDVAAAAYGATFESSGKNSGNPADFINSKVDSKNEYSMVINSHIGENSSASHFVSISGRVETKSDGSKNVPITPTSSKDYGMNNYNRGGSGWSKSSDGSVNASVKNDDYAYSFGHGGCNN